MSYKYVLDLTDEMPEIPPDGITSRTFFKSPYMKAMMFGFDAGEELSQHTSAYPAILYFLQGEADLVLGEDRQIARPGTWVYMEPNLPHSVQAKTPLLMLLMLLQPE